MASRSTNRFNQKTAIPFGDFMLPILGVIALGILVVGIRVFFLPSNKTVSLQKPAAVPKVSVPKPAAAVKQAPKNNDAAQNLEEGKNSFTARPASPETRTVSKTKPTAVVVPEGASEPPRRAVPFVRSQPSNVSTSSRRKQSTVVATAAPNQRSGSVLVKGGSIDGSAFLVQCGSFTENDTAAQVSDTLKKRGYAVSIQKAPVKGRVYYRVYVAGGKNHDVASAVAEQLNALGYPILIVKKPKSN